MRITELIAALEAIRAATGDLDVLVNAGDENLYRFTVSAESSVTTGPFAQLDITGSDAIEDVVYDVS